MTLKNIFYGLVCVLCFGSCQQATRWQIAQATSVKIPLDSTTNSIANKEYQAYLQPFKQKIDDELNTVIGYSMETMEAKRPESLLSNFSADMLCEVTAQTANVIVDMAIVNMGGLRTQLPQGDITRRNIFELMPFENELVVLWLKGDKLSELMEVIASVGGEGISSDVKLGIKDKKVAHVEVGGKPIDNEKLYIIATSDYLAGGNDRLVQLAQCEKRLDTGLKLRDVYIDYIKSQTEKGKQITAKLDKRIYYVD